MNRKMILHILGSILIVEAFLMLPSVAVGLIYSEAATVSFLIPIAILLAVGFLMRWKKPQDTTIYARDGFFIVASAWLLMSLAGALPFHLCGGFDSFWDCFFEMVSGFTTTGASIHSDVDALPHCILFWRSFSHWIGGMGVLVFVLAITPLSEERSMHLMRAEVPGPIVGKLVPKMRDTAKILYGVYSTMTILLVIFLLCGGMPLFDALCNAFATAGTGGFAIRTAGIPYYNSAYIEIVLAVFMLLFGINFNLFYFILIGKAKTAFKSEELHWYAAIVGVATLIIGINIFPLFSNTFDSFRHAFFQVASIITTTGFASYDFLQFPAFSQHIIVLLMMVGACAGSTGGGLKISRVMILIKSFGQEIKRLFHPHAVTAVRLEGKAIDKATLRGTLSYFAIYIMIICASTLLISIDGFDLTTNFTAVLSCVNNIGPGLGKVGPMSNFGEYRALSKILLSFDMLLGRLEILPMLVLFTPGAWRKN